MTFNLSASEKETLTKKGSKTVAPAAFHVNVEYEEQSVVVDVGAVCVGVGVGAWCGLRAAQGFRRGRGHR